MVTLQCVIGGKHARFSHSCKSELPCPSFQSNFPQIHHIFREFPPSPCSSSYTIPLCFGGSSNPRAPFQGPTIRVGKFACMCANYNDGSVKKILIEIQKNLSHSFQISEDLYLYFLTNTPILHNPQHLLWDGGFNSSF